MVTDDWKREFKRAIVRATIPTWELREGDEIVVSFTARDNYDPFYEGNDQVVEEWVEGYVEVSRPGSSESASGGVDGRSTEELAGFLNRLFE
jgi:hypothetical protein